MGFRALPTPRLPGSPTSKLKDRERIAVLAPVHQRAQTCVHAVFHAWDGDGKAQCHYNGCG